MPHSSVHHMYMAGKSNLKPEPKYRRTFIREWRAHRDLSLVQVAERVRTFNPALKTTHASLSRIENQKQPYSQPLLEAIADALHTDVASLLMRDPTDSEALWSIWDQATKGQRQTLVDIAQTLKKSAG